MSDMHVLVESLSSRDATAREIDDVTKQQPATPLSIAVHEYQVGPSDEGKRIIRQILSAGASKTITDISGKPLSGDFKLHPDLVPLLQPS